MIPPPVAPPLLLRALAGESTERTPVWLMRQAGRSDPEYRALRERERASLEELFRNVEVAVEISLLPRRVGVDGIIFFQDILTPLAPMGAPFLFRPGPCLEKPIRTAAQVEALTLFDVAAELPFVGETLSLLRTECGPELPVLGFAGAPLTLLYFLVEGRSPGEARNATRMLSEAPEVAHALLGKLTELTIRYLKYQIASGAQAVQLFESVADLPGASHYREFALPYQRKVFEALGAVVPRILFAKGFGDLLLLRESGADVYSIAGTCSIAEARARLGQSTILQGNVSNRLLAEGSFEAIERATRDCIDSGESRGHVLNLDHGLLQHTPWENVAHFVECAKTRIRCLEREKGTELWPH